MMINNIDILIKKCSPNQISGRLKLANIQITHETIDQYIELWR